MEIKEQILVDKIDNIIKRNSTNISDAILNMQTETALLDDFLIKGTAINFTANGSIKAGIQTNNYRLHNNALTQLVSKLGIPIQYVRKLQETEWGRTLLATILKTHCANYGNKLLVRVIHNEVRGILSDSYHRYDTSKSYLEFLQVAEQAGCKLYDAYYDNLSGHITVINPKIYYLKDMDTEPYMFGAKITNGSFGTSALTIKAFILKVVCNNGMTREIGIKTVHRASKITNIDGIKLSKDTLEAETRAKALFIRDVAKYIFSEKTREGIFNSFNEAMGKSIDFTEAVEVLPKLGVQESEIQTLTEKLLNRDIKDGIPPSNTLFAFAQGLSAVARDSEPDRKVHLNDVVGKLLFN